MKRTFNYTVRHLFNPEMTMTQAIVIILGIIIFGGIMGGFVILIVFTHLFYK